MLKNKQELPQFQEPQEWQEKINEFKKSLVGLSTAEIARHFAMRRREKKEHEEIVKGINTEMEACSQLLVEQLQDQEVQKVTLASGETVYLQSKVYPSVSNRDELRQWAIDSGQIEILSVHPQTLTGIVNKRLADGLEPPPGVSVFLKTQAKCREN